MKKLTIAIWIICSFIFGYFVLQNQGIEVNPKYLGFVLIGFGTALTLTIINLFRAKEIRQKLLLIFIPFLLGVIFLEFYDLKDYFTHQYYLKLYNPPKSPYHTYPPNSITQWENDEFEHYRTHNSLGLCDVEPQIKEDTNIYTIIGLGDSFTEGLGAYSDSTWLKFLERKFASDTITKYQFINAGIAGSDPVYEYVLLRDKLLKFKPNLVILALGYEQEEMMIRGGFERFQADGTIQYRKKPFWYPLYKISGIFRLFARNSFANQMLIPKYLAETEEKMAILKIQFVINKFKYLSKKHNFKFTLAIYPQYWEVVNKKHDYWTETINFARQNNITTVDLLKFYTDSIQMNKSNISDYYWMKDGHHNAKGYEKMAEGILHSILQFTPNTLQKK